MEEESVRNFLTESQLRKRWVCLPASHFTVGQSLPSLLFLCFRLIFEKFSSRDPNSKDNSVGIQLLGIVMANNLPPYDLKCGIESTK